MSRVTRRILLGLVSVAGAGLGAYYYKNPSEAKKHKDLVTKNLKEKLEKISATDNTKNEIENETAKQVEIESKEEITIEEKQEAKEKLDKLISAFAPKEEVVAVSQVEEEFLEEVTTEEINELSALDEVPTLVGEGDIFENLADSDIEEIVEIVEIVEDENLETVQETEETIEEDDFENETDFKNFVADISVKKNIEGVPAEETTADLENIIEDITDEEVIEEDLTHLIEEVKEKTTTAEGQLTLSEAIEEAKEIANSENFIEEDETEEENEAKNALESIVAFFSSKKI